MSALTTDGCAIYEKWTRYQFRLASGVKAFKGGTAIGIQGIGWVEPGVSSGIGSGDVWLGTFSETVDNTSGSSTIIVNVDFLDEKTVIWRVNDGSVTSTDVFSIGYVVDDATVSKTSTGRVICGMIVAVEPTRGVAIEVGRTLRVGSSASGPASGDLGGDYPNPSVLKVNGASYPAGGSLTTGQVPRVTGASTVAYGAVDLANASAVTGVLPDANQAAQTMGGDVTGTTGASVVAKAHGATVPAAGSLTTGNVLQVSGASALVYAAVNLAGGAGCVTGSLPAGNQAAQTMGGDVTGNTGASVVAKVNGATAPAAGSLTTGNVCQVSGASALTYAALNLAGGANYVTGVLPAANQAAQTHGGSLGGTTAAATVVQVDGSGAGGTLNVLPATITWNSAFSNRGIDRWDGDSTADATQKKIGQVVCTDNRLTCIKATFVGHNRSNGDGLAIVVDFAVERHSGGGANAIAAQTKTDIARSAGASAWTADLVISASTVGYFVTGAAATSVSWSVHLEIVEGG